MIKIKKCIILFVVLIAAVAMVSCGDKYADSPYVGTWNATVATMDGVEINVSDVLGEFSMVINADGTLEMTVDDEGGEASWEETDKGFVIEDGEQSMEFIASGDTIYVEQSGVNIYFEKE